MWDWRGAPSAERDEAEDSVVDKVVYSEELHKEVLGLLLESEEAVFSKKWDGWGRIVNHLQLSVTPYNLKRHIMRKLTKTKEKLMANARE